MTYAVAFLPAARADLLGIIDHTTKENPKRALSFVDKLQRRIRSRLELFPHSGPAIGAFRFIVFSGYVAVYSVDEQARQVRVLLVTEGHRNWRAVLAARR